jgi:hypothetical protein
MTGFEAIKALRAFMGGTPPDEELIHLLLSHGCGYLFPDRLPTEKLALNRMAVKERLRVCKDVFARIDFPYAVVKGAVLSQRVHDDPFRRMSGDVDLLIRRQDADALKALLHAEGFIQGRITEEGVVPFSRREILFQTAMSHQTAPYIKETGHPLCPYVNVDANMDILWGESEARGDMDLVLAHTESANILGTSLRRLTPEMEFIALCLHHYKDINSLYLLSRGSLRLKPFMDLYLYLKNVRPRADVICTLAEKLSVGAYLCVCLAQVNEIFSDEISEAYYQALIPYEQKELNNALGLNAQERRSWDISLLERLFHSDLLTHISSRLTTEDKMKIELNSHFM